MCEVCRTMVVNVARHLQYDHPKIELAAYIEQFPTAKLEGAASTDTAPVVVVSAREAAEHPGGRHGAIIEKSLGRDERRSYREDVQALRNDGYPSGYQVASVAYLMILARRTRFKVEQVRIQSRGDIIPSEDLKLLEDLQATIASNLRDLEKIRQVRNQEGAETEPLSVIEGTLDEAEAWVRAHQGELVDRCSGCGLMITPTGLPFWAYTMIQTSTGPEPVVWSPELWRLVLSGTIPVWIMAYALRTSPEGLRHSARRRGEPWPETIVLEVEEQALRAILDVQDRERPAPLTPIREEPA